MNKITKKATQHKELIVSEIEALSKSYNQKVKKLKSLFVFQSSKEQLIKEIIELEKELEHKLKIASMMRGF
jgi:hypothetical protein